MSKTERDPFGPGFQWRLRSALDRIEPVFSAPRYATATSRDLSPFRFTRLALASGVAGIVALTAFAATGSANPADWTQRIVTTIRPVVVEPSPSLSPSTPSSQAAAPAAPASKSHPVSTPLPADHETPGATPRPEPSESPEPSSGGTSESSASRRS